jgi:phenylacetate-CoA ligase
VNLLKKTPLEGWILEKIECNLKERRKEDLIEYIEKYQLKKLKENIDYVKRNSAFYRGYLKEICSEEIKSFKNFEKIPFTNSKQIKDNSSHFLCVSQQHISRIVSLDTSGTSGNPKRIYFTEEDQELTVDFFQNGMTCLVEQGDRVLILLPGHTPGSIGDLLKRALERINVEAHIFGVIKDFEEASEVIKEKNINCVVGIPIQVVSLKRKFNETFEKYIKKILLSTDYVPETIIRELTSKQCKVFTHYGMTEMGLGGGVECEALNGYHMREADLYFEIINPKTGEVLKDGEYGEIVFTTLTRKGMPLIRYRTGDIGRFINKPCECGTVLKTMERVLGRIENSINLFEDKFLNMRDLDEVILQRKEIVNYKVDVVRNTKENYFSIIIKLQINKEIFEEIKAHLNKVLYEIPVICEGIKRGKVKLIFEESDEEIVTGNGTVKRKIKVT